MYEVLKGSELSILACDVTRVGPIECYNYNYRVCKYEERRVNSCFQRICNYLMMITYRVNVFHFTGKFYFVKEHLHS